MPDLENTMREKSILEDLNSEVRHTPEQDFLTVGEVAELAGITSQKLSRQIKPRGYITKIAKSRDGKPPLRIALSSLEPELQLEYFRRRLRLNGEPLGVLYKLSQLLRDMAVKEGFSLTGFTVCMPDKHGNLQYYDTLLSAWRKTGFTGWGRIDSVEKTTVHRDGAYFEKQII